jgi:multidrug efflux pump subunit AcrB
MMTGDGADYAQLKKAAEGFRQRLTRVPGVKKINLYGTQDERIYVEFSHAKLATLGVTPQALFDSLAKQNNVTPAGTVETSSQRVPLRVTGALDGLAHRHRGGDVGTARARDRFHRHERDVARPASHYAGCADHRTGLARR